MDRPAGESRKEFLTALACSARAALLTSKLSMLHVGHWAAQQHLLSSVAWEGVPRAQKRAAGGDYTYTMQLHSTAHEACALAACVGAGPSWSRFLMSAARRKLASHDLLDDGVDAGLERKLYSIDGTREQRGFCL